jgi:integrase
METKNKKTGGQPDGRNKNTFERLERHLYKSSYRMNSGQWSVYYVAVFKDWAGKMRRIRLSADLKTARILLKELEVKNDKKIDLDAEKKAKQQRENAMTIAKWIPLCKQLPEMCTKKNGQLRRSLDRDNQLYAHIIRLMGGRQLAEISRADLETYKVKRGSETLFRCGKWTKVPVSSGTIRNELAALRRVLNLARLHKDEMAKKHGIVYQVSDVSFEGVLPNAQTRERPLKVSEKKTLLPACSPWLRKLLIVAMETCLSRGDLLRLTWDDIDWDDGVIVPGGGRKKTQVRQIAPLTETVRTILEEIKQERKGSKVENIAGTGLVFVRDDGRPISGNAITKALHKACKRAKVRNFRFHDTRHTAKTEWARKGIPVEAAMLAAGHSSIQMHQAYVHLQKSDIGKAFGTSKFYNGFKTDSDASVKG